MAGTPAERSTSTFEVLLGRTRFHVVEQCYGKVHMRCTRCTKCADMLAFITGMWFTNGRACTHSSGYVHKGRST